MMEDLYSNLENYDEVNVVAELRNENKELKHKLEERSNAMNQLQRDFDKLNSEYKKLEINYSSLLKTARAEIERKTQLITNLNKEKDMIVIKAMQGGRNVLNNPVPNYNKNDTVKKVNENKEALAKNKMGPALTPKESSRETPLQPTKHATATISSISSEQKLRQLEVGSSKENKSAPYQKHNDDKTKSARISDRRKSMPVLGNYEEQFNSDEDIVRDNYRNIESNKFQDYGSHNRQSLESREGLRTHRSEQLRYESKQPYHRETDKYSSHFDKYSTSHSRNYDAYSYERGRRQHRGSDYSQRSLIGQRVLESPPKDKYSRSKSRERRHRDRDDKWDFDYNKPRYEDRYDNRSNTREPDYKRQRVESTGVDYERHREDRATEKRSYRPSEFGSGVVDDNFTSCQSPDYDQYEYVATEHNEMKEIKDTASVQLEDPRITSKKYYLKDTDEGTYITTCDKNIFLIPVDKLRWGFKKAEVPEALNENTWKEPPDEDILNCIYSDIDDPANVSFSKTITNSKNLDVDKFETTDNLDSVGGKTIMDAPETNMPALKNIRSDYKIPKQSKINVKIGDSNLNTHPLPQVQHYVAGDLELSDETSDITDELQITCKQNDDDILNVVGGIIANDKKCKKKDNRMNQKTERNIENSNSTLHQKNIKESKTTIDSVEVVETKVDSKKACKTNAPIKKMETCRKKLTKKKICDDEKKEKQQDNNDVKIIQKSNESSKPEPKETKKRGKRKRLSSKESEIEKHESGASIIIGEGNYDQNVIKDSKSTNKFTELFGESSSLITPEDLNMPTKFHINTERNDNYGSLFENTQDAIDINVKDIKKVPLSECSHLEKVESLTGKEDSQNLLDKESILEIKDSQIVDKAFKNLKPALNDDECNIVKTVVISSGTQPCIEGKIKKQEDFEDVHINKEKPEENIMLRPLVSLRAVATSTPNKMQLEEYLGITPTTNSSSVNPQNDTKLTFSASLTTTTHVEADTDAPDVRIFIKRRRKIRKIS